MAEKFSLKDHLFNPDSVGDLASEFASALPDFDAARFQREALSGFAERELLARMDWMADCLEGQLAGDFPTMAAQLEAAMPPELDPSLTTMILGGLSTACPAFLRCGMGWRITGNGRLICFMRRPNGSRWSSTSDPF